MEERNYLKDIADIKQMMSRSSRFISLSGLSGILAGIYALLGAAAAWFQLDAYRQGYPDYLTAVAGGGINSLTRNLFLIAGAVIVASIVTAIILTTRKARKNDEKIWDSVSKRLLLSFAIPLVSGGLFCLAILQRDITGLIAPATLLFYGLALINASKYTLGDIKYLGMANVVTGLIATQFAGYGLYFWALGFGVFHIIYGFIMYNKYD